MIWSDLAIYAFQGFLTFFPLDLRFQCNFLLGGKKAGALQKERGVCGVLRCCSNSKSTSLRFCVLTALNFCDHNFENHRLAFRDQLPLIVWQLGEQRQFQPLHDRFNAP